MKRYSVQSAKPSDLEAVYKIIANQNTLDYGSALITLEDLQKKWQELNLNNDTCIAYANREIQGYAELMDGDWATIYLADRGNVDLAFHLLMILEGKVTSQHKGKVNLFTRISEKNNTLLQLFASNGYRSNLSFLIMAITLNEATPIPNWPDGINVRTFTSNQDEEATYRADEEAAEDKGYHDPLGYEAWVKRMGLDKASFDPGLWFLACDQSEIAGVALNLINKESNTGWVDHLSVRRAWRKRGIGQALLLHSFNEFYQRGIRHVQLSVDSKSLTNAPHLYESVGMQTVQQYHIYKKEFDVYHD